jgi:hypothetical protein
MVFATALLCAAPASAAEPQLIGQVGGASALGGCTCSAFQRTTAAGPGYAFPFSGILTKVRVFVGEFTQASDTVQARTFRALGPSTASVIGGGEAHSLFGLPPKAPSTFVDRIPATAGDLLGARFAVNPLLGETASYFTTASATDATSFGAVTLDPVIGSSYSTSNTSNARANVEAVLEHDEDGDGYGDASQDLCPGSPIAASACSGTLFGSNLQGQRSAPPPGCGFGGCMRIQKKMGGVSTAASFDGVVVRWRVLDGETGTYHARVVVPNPAASGGAFSGYTVLHSSAAESVTAPVQPLFSKISTFQARLPIPAGAFVGLSVPSLSDQGFQASGGAAVYDEPNDGGDGLTVSGVSHNGTLLYDADIEPDADHDGYGDLSQDKCASDASTQGACQSLVALAAAGSGVGSTLSITDFKATPKSFRVKPKGAVVSRHAVHAGTTLRLTLSEAATVTFKLKASSSCGPAKARSCPKGSSGIPTFKRSLHKGKNAIPYSGRYAKPPQKPKALKPGDYQVTAIATDATGKASAPAQTSFLVRP